MKSTSTRVGHGNVNCASRVGAGRRYGTGTASGTPDALFARRIDRTAQQQQENCTDMSNAIIDVLVQHMTGHSGWPNMKLWGDNLLRYGSLQGTILHSRRRWMIKFKYLSPQAVEEFRWLIGLQIPSTMLKNHQKWAPQTHPSNHAWVSRGKFKNFPVERKGVPTLIWQASP